MSSSIVLVGDSLSVGAFPALKAVVPEALLIAKVGASTAWMEGQLAAVQANAPRRVLLMAGTNDLAGAAPEVVVERVKKLAGLLYDTGTSSVVVSLLPPQSPADGAGNARVNAFNALLSAWSPPTPTGITVEPVGRVLDVADVAADPMGIHPGSDGYARLGDAWADVAVNGKLDPLALIQPQPAPRGEPSIGFGTIALTGLAVWGVSRLLR